MTLIKGILLPVRAEYLVRILNGEKTQELRKSIPKGFVGWVYLYCTKALPYLYGADLIGKYRTDTYDYLRSFALNGKVVARFWFDEYDVYDFSDFQHSYRILANQTYDQIFTNKPMPLSKLCLTDKEINTYGKKKVLYIWHIKQLEIFAEPKELKDFYVLRHELVDNDFLNPPYWCDVKHTLTKAPHNWQYVYTKEKE